MNKIQEEIDFEVNEKIHTLSFEYIIETYMQASEESQLVFLVALKKAIEANYLLRFIFTRNIAVTVSSVSMWLRSHGIKEPST